jgi:protein involved in sex pheromone biosynthesis
MKKLVVATSIIASVLFLSGCGETLGKMMLKTGMTPDMKIVTDKKIVKKD